MRITRGVVAILAAVSAACSVDASTAPLVARPVADVGSEAIVLDHYEVTITNATSGQPFSPAVIVLLEEGYFAHGWNPVEPAPDWLRELAEDGTTAGAIAHFASDRGVGSVVATGTPLHRIGGTGANSISVQLSVRRTRYPGWRLAMAFMKLDCTNDGFAFGFTSLDLGGSLSQPLIAFDAGTERNTERDGDLVPECFTLGPVPGTGGSGHVDELRETVRYHKGINEDGGVLKKELHGWGPRQTPVGTIKVRYLGSSS